MKMVFKGFYLERQENSGMSRPAVRSFDAIGIPIFHSRREAWKFLRGWSRQGLTTKELKSKGYHCMEVKVIEEEE